MRHDKWIEALFKLKRYHVQEIRSFHIDETSLLVALNRDNRLEITQIVRLVDSSVIIRKQLDRLRQLTQERELRYQALIKRHVEELNNLSNFGKEESI